MIIILFPVLCCVVERRRRDRINDMIKTLAQIVPGCQKKDSATGNIVGVSLTLVCLHTVP